MSQSQSILLFAMKSFTSVSNPIGHRLFVSGLNY